MRMFLTIPPSVNSLYFNSKKGRVKTKEYSTWQQTAMIEARNVSFTMFDKPVKIEVAVGKVTQARDLDNFLKPICDFLVKRQVIKDDNLLHVHSVSVRRAFGEVLDGFVRVDVSEANNEDLR